MSDKSTGKKIILAIALLSICLNLILIGYIVLNNGLIQSIIPGGNSRIIGRWEKILLPEDQPYQGIPTPQIYGLLPIAGSPTSTPGTITIIPNTCRSNYPQSLEFFNDATYTASGKSLFPALSGGDYQITDDGRLKTESYNSLVTYELSFENDQMTMIFLDCKIVYQKIDK